MNPGYENPAHKRVSFAIYDSRMRNVLTRDRCHPAPRWKPLAWFVKSGNAPMPEIENGLRSMLFRRLSSIVAVSIANTTMLTIAVLRHPGGAFLVWAVVGCSLEAIRLINIAVIGHAIATQSMQRSRYVVDLFVATSLLWALLLGCGCFLCLWSGDIVLVLFSIFMSVGVIGAISGRSPGSPRLSVTQMILILVPLTAGLLIASDTGMRLIAVLAPPYLWGMWAINTQLHGDYVAMLTAQWENRNKALHCGLTRLPNVTYFYESLAAALSMQDDGPVAVLALDLDGFKAVNDRYGHPVGDSLLKAVAERIHRVDSSTVFAARIGGDEFALVLQGQDAETAELMAARLIHDISRPYGLDNVTAYIGVSIGIARCRSRAMTPIALHAQADKALYRAKAECKGHWWVFEDPTEADGEPVSERLDGAFDADDRERARIAVGPDLKTKAA